MSDVLISAYGYVLAGGLLSNFRKHSYRPATVTKLDFMKQRAQYVTKATNKNSLVPKADTALLKRKKE